MTFYEFLHKNKLIKGLLIIILVMLILHLGYYMWNGYTLNSEYVSLKPPIEKTKGNPTPPKNRSEKKVEPAKVITPKIKYIYVPQKSTENKKDTSNLTNQKNTTAPVSVTSYGQIGGITANQVNIGKDKKVRSLTTGDKEFLLKFLPDKNEKIKIMYLINDNEGYQYAKQFYDFLLAYNYTNVDKYIGPIMTSKPLLGQYIYRNDKKEVEIKIGAVED